MRWIAIGLCLTLAAGLEAHAQQAPARQASAPHASVGQQAVSADLIRLHDDLKLTSSQETAWRAYATAIAPDPQAMVRHKAATDLIPLIPTPRRIALIEATMAQDAADFHRQGAAVRTFYNQLTQMQQLTFDRETLPSGSEQTRP